MMITINLTVSELFLLIDSLFFSCQCHHHTYYVLILAGKDLFFFHSNSHDAVFWIYGKNSIDSPPVF